MFSSSRDYNLITAFQYSCVSVDLDVYVWGVFQAGLTPRFKPRRNSRSTNLKSRGGYPEGHVRNCNSLSIDAHGAADQSPGARGGTVFRVVSGTGKRASAYSHSLFCRPAANLRGSRNLPPIRPLQSRALRPAFRRRRIASGFRQFDYRPNLTLA